HELRILTEDVTMPRPYVHKVGLSRFWKSSILGQFARMIAYHRAAMRLRKNFPFDVLVYNHALIGLWSAYRFKATVGMVNDDNNLTASWRHLGLSRLGTKRHLFRFIEKAMTGKAQKIIVNSDYLKEKLAKTYHIPANRLHRLYKAVEVPIKVSAEIDTIDPTAPIRVMFVKNDYQRGGLFTLTRGLSLLPFQFVLIIVGPNPADREKILSDLGKYPNIVGDFLGKIPQIRVLELLKKSHIFCVPSHQEALGVANLEAMAQGVPVISTKAGGIPEVLDQGRCGWLVPPNDSAALAEAIAECVRRPDLRATKVRNAHAQVGRFNPQTMFENFLDILSR
ncbi:glycosyltransferase family 4 protein, partial [Persicitalea sp.]|uniref:glycosyltransferase family 4 protein n=1 Tax=Persicitalea sp. TaxID=3100273 RepID=UPI003593CE35